MRDSNRVKILPPKISKTEFDSNQVYLLLEKQIFLFLSDSLDYLSHSTSSLNYSLTVCSMTKSCFSGFLGHSMHCNVGVCAIILEWSVVETSEPEMAGVGLLGHVGPGSITSREAGGLCCMIFSFSFSSFTFFPAHSMSDYVGLSPRGREGGSYVPAIPTAAAADQNHRPHCWGRDTRECDEH